MGHSAQLYRDRAYQVTQHNPGPPFAVGRAPEWEDQMDFASAFLNPRLGTETTEVTRYILEQLGNPAPEDVVVFNTEDDTDWDSVLSTVRALWAAKNYDPTNYDPTDEEQGPYYDNLKSVGKNAKLLRTHLLDVCPIIRIETWQAEDGTIYCIDTDNHTGAVSGLWLPKARAIVGEMK